MGVIIIFLLSLCFSLIVMYESVSVAAFAYDIYLLVTRSVDGECGTNFVSYVYYGPTLSVYCVSVVILEVDQLKE